VVTAVNSKSALQNPVANNQWNPVKSGASIASNANAMMYIEDMLATQVTIIASVETSNQTEHQTTKKLISIQIPKVKKKVNYMLRRVINPIKRNKNFINSSHYNILCKKMGLIITSTGECKPKFVDEEDGTHYNVYQRM